jgi:hypothetical protein
MASGETSILHLATIGKQKSRLLRSLVANVFFGPDARISRNRLIFIFSQA